MNDLARTQSHDADADSWSPNTDIYKSHAEMLILVELAGITRDNLDLNIQGRSLAIQGNRLDLHRPADSKVLQAQLRYGPFKSVIPVPPPYDLQQAKASYQNGLLLIRIPRKSSPGWRKIMQALPK